MSSHFDDQHHPHQSHHQSLLLTKCLLIINVLVIYGYLNIFKTLVSSDLVVFSILILADKNVFEIIRLMSILWHVNIHKPDQISRLAHS